jgi:dolichyl-phosphate-mannose--protein O-mannosyl transferase
MNDIYMLNFYLWSLYAAVRNRWRLASVLFGLALGSKWSALYGLLPLAFLYLHQHPLKQWNLRQTLIHIFTALRYLLLALCIYVLTFTPFILVGHTWEQWWELHRQMWYYHTHLVATHGYQSSPWQWLFAARPVWYWVEYGTSVISNIYVQGNPIILWLGLVALILELPQVFRFPFSFFFLAYGIFVFPWLFSPRIMFYYHYLPSATFLTILLALYLDSLPTRLKLFILILCFLSLLLISPLLYGFPLPSSFWDTLFRLFPSWR